MSFDPISAGIGTGVGLAEAAVGLIDSGKANREAKQLAASRPKYTESPYVKDELNLAESNLGSGVGADATKTYTEGIDRSLSTSLDAILKGGGSTNNIGAIFDNSVQGRQRLTLMNENIRLNNVDRLVKAQNASEEEKEKAFQYNIDAPWKDAAQANSQARQNASKMIWSGVDTAAGSAMKGFSDAAGKKQLDDYFKVSPSNKSDDWYGSDPLQYPESTPSDVQTQRLQY